jgi:hypothetical protein
VEAIAIDEPYHAAYIGWSAVVIGRLSTTALDLYGRRQFRVSRLSSAPSDVARHGIVGPVIGQRDGSRRGAGGENTPSDVARHGIIGDFGGGSGEQADGQ